MSALAVPTPVSPGAGARPRPRHLQLVGPGFVPAPEVQRPARPAAVTPPRSTPSVARTERPGLRLTARGRLVRSAALLLLATLLAVATGSWLGSVMAGGESYSGPVQRVTVSTGDTLWGIAGATAAAEGLDVRDVVDDILRINGLESGDLAVGQQLLVPAG